MTSKRESGDAPGERRSWLRRSSSGRMLSRITTGVSLPFSSGIMRPDAGALAVLDFRRFWFGMIISNIGSWMQMVAQGWLILELTDSPFYLGLVGLVRAVPALIVTPLGGVLADRVDRRTILLVTQVAAAICAITLGLLDLTGLVAVWHILLIAFISTVVMSLDNPARQAMVPNLVGRDQMASAIGLNSAAWNGAAVVGPSLAGVLVALVSTAGAFLLNGVSYFAVVYAVWKMKPVPQRPRGNQTVLQNLTAGLQFITQDRRIWGIIAILALPTFFGRPYIQMMPVFARDVLSLGPGGYGLLMGVSGAGALIGALGAGMVGSSKRKGKLMLYLAGLFGITLFLFALSTWLVPSLVLLVLVGATQTLLMVLANTLLQFNVTDDMRGRVMSVYTLIPMSLLPLGSMVVGSLGELYGVPITVAVGALIVVGFSIFAYRNLTEVRQMQ